MTVPICFASDDNYAQYLGVAIQSIVHFANPGNTYDIYVLDDKISELKKNKINKLAKPNVLIHFLDICFLYQKYDLASFYISGYVSAAAYLRLFIPEIFASHDKMVYLDCDLVLNTDVASLFEIELGDNYLAAARDMYMLHDNNPAVAHYFKKHLDIEKPEDYFNSGVMLLNIKKIRADWDKLQGCIRITKRPRWYDQCILNRFAYGHVLHLPLTWNYWGRFKVDNPNYRETFPRKYLSAFKTASQHPCAIHAKPWREPTNEYAEVFWMHARNTPFYESILYANIALQSASNSVSSKHDRKKILRKYNRYLLLSYLTLMCVPPFNKRRKKYACLLLEDSRA